MRRARTRPITRVLPALVAAAALVAACGGDEEPEEPVGAPTTTVTTPEGDLAEPLTGLPAEGDALADRPAMVVKVDNSPRAVGRQRGVQRADVVFVEKVEGGATRMAAVFHSDVDVEVGPVRSARTSDLAIVANLNHPIFVFSGANGGVLRDVEAADVEALYYDETKDLFEERGSGDLRLVASLPDLYEEATDITGTPPPLFTYREEGDPPVAGAAVGRIDLDYGGQRASRVAWQPAAEGWARLQGGEPHLDADGAALTATNVVVQFVEYTDSGFVDTSGTPSPEAQLVGEGDAWVLTGGTLVQGRWSRFRDEAVTVFTDGNGRPIDLDPGRTWVELAPAGGGTVTPPGG